MSASLVHVKSRWGQMSSCCCGAEVWRGGCQLRYRPHHLTAVQNYKVVCSGSPGALVEHIPIHRPKQWPLTCMSLGNPGQSLVSCLSSALYEGQEEVFIDWTTILLCPI
ncbi:hypothetical protein AVEN_47113-1 [Araneus ventricosus]|uniref:Uncharacterized protein n=1 Tax=Araneus ventricosus TaxID=182803 RepID=A0A4Y2LAV0_ARAVE|nr:hypothetical protein AVEN_47113-1 [Araneus ventricosus]